MIPYEYTSYNGLGAWRLRAKLLLSIGIILVTTSSSSRHRPIIVPRHHTTSAKLSTTLQSSTFRYEWTSMDTRIIEQWTLLQQNRPSQNSEATQPEILQGNDKFCSGYTGVSAEHTLCRKTKLAWAYIPVSCQRAVYCMQPVRSQYSL